MLLAVRGEIHPGHDSDNEVSEALGDFFLQFGELAHPHGTKLLMQ